MFMSIRTMFPCSVILDLINFQVYQSTYTPTSNTSRLQISHKIQNFTLKIMKLKGHQKWIESHVHTTQVFYMKFQVAKHAQSDNCLTWVIKSIIYVCLFGIFLFYKTSLNPPRYLHVCVCVLNNVSWSKMNITLFRSMTCYVRLTIFHGISVYLECMWKSFVEIVSYS